MQQSRLRPRFGLLNLANLIV